MITVYVWNFQGVSVAWGHASMKVDGGSPPGDIYISWWPQGAGRTAKIPGAIGPLRDVYSVAAIMGRTYSDDVRDEGSPPDHTLYIDGLDETAIKTWWDALIKSKSPTWSSLGKNCSTTVGHALMAGGGDARTKGFSGWWDSWNVVWTPNDVLNYALAIGGTR